MMALDVRVWFHLIREISLMKSTLMHGVMALTVVAGFGLCLYSAAGDDKPSTAKVFELRTYKTHPGKLAALHARFRDHTCKLFAKHGIELVGFWTPAEGDEAADTLVYIVAFPSVEAQKQSWQAFQADPEWKQAKADSEKDGPIVSKVETKNLTATDYSPIK
jgi:hypothetical protein